MLVRLTVLAMVSNTLMGSLIFKRVNGKSIGCFHTISSLTLSLGIQTWTSLSYPLYFPPSKLALPVCLFLMILGASGGNISNHGFPSIPSLRPLTSTPSVTGRWSSRNSTCPVMVRAVRFDTTSTIQRVLVVWMVSVLRVGGRNQVVW